MKAGRIFTVPAVPLLSGFLRQGCPWMTVYVALLRAVNVGGSGIIAMKDVRALCTRLGLDRVRTVLQSGNVLFESQRDEPALKRELEQAATEKVGRPVAVLIRTGRELRAALDANPFRDARPSQVGVLFLANPGPADSLAGLVIPGREAVHMAGREVFVHYPDGMGRSKLKLPFAADGTMRNLNTVARLLAMAEA
jgi:uncharacterized protein (DUF1697 family)